ncbi:MAG: helix-turn-helix domain-containing protein [Anaerostipes sp.]|uniref:helix-turn-helix domain-containing protein n=1 Tax=Anaerostipes sp. TaxID=1872530 RepID=UPI00399508E0
MGNFQNILKSLRTSQSLTQDALAKKLKISRSTIGMYENGAREPDFETLELIADFFNVDIDYLLGRTLKTTYIPLTETQSALSKRDEKDIAKRLEQTLDQLESDQDGLMFSGEPLDDETRELLKASLENSITIAKINAKQKFTPKKYRK